MPGPEAQKRGERRRSGAGERGSVPISPGVSFGTVPAPVPPDSFHLPDGPNEPFDFLEIVVFIYVSIISADIYYVGFLDCVSSAALS